MKNRQKVRLVGMLAAVLFSAGVTEPGLAAAPPAGPVVDIQVSDGRLTVDVRDAPLAQVLRIVGEKSGVAVTLRGDLAAPVTQSFAGVALEEGIRRLARDVSVAVTYGASAEDPKREVLTGIWIVGGGSSRGSTAASTSAPTSTPPLEARPGERPHESRLPSLEPPKFDGPGAEATVDFALTERTREIQALAEEAHQGRAEAMARLAHISASEPDATIRLQAVAALGRLQVPGVEPALTVALTDDDASIRVRAVRGLRGAGTETSEQSLARVVTGDPDPQVRLSALSALTSLPGRAMLQGLAKASVDPDARVREAAIRGLSWWNMHLPSTP